MKRFRRAVKGALVMAAALSALAAVIEQLRLPPGERTWHGRVAGIPYDFRVPTPARVKAAWWNPQDSRILTPQAFGVGWVINLYRLLHLNEPPSASWSEWDEEA